MTLCDAETVEDLLEVVHPEKDGEVHAEAERLGEVVDELLMVTEVLRLGLMVVVGVVDTVTL